MFVIFWLYIRHKFAHFLVGKYSLTELPGIFMKHKCWAVCSDISEIVTHEGHKQGPLLFMMMVFLPPPSRLWSSWIPNFSRCLTWSKPTGPNGRNWTRRDNVARVFLHPQAPAVATAQKQVAMLWPKRAAHPAVAAMLMAHHLDLLVSFWCHLRADLLGLFPLTCSLQQRQCSACRGSWALLLFAFATRDEL